MKMFLSSVIVKWLLLTKKNLSGFGGKRGLSNKSEKLGRKSLSLNGWRKREESVDHPFHHRSNPSIDRSIRTDIDPSKSIKGLIIQPIPSFLVM